jgi:hypothetical protein
VIIGKKVLFTYLMLTYGLQSLLAMVFPSLFSTEYKGYADGVLDELAFMLVIGIFIFAGQSIIARKSQLHATASHRSPLVGKLLRTARTACAVTFIGLSIPFGLEYGFSFFHSGLYISDLPFWVVLLQAMKPLARLDLAYCTIKAIRGNRLGNTDLFMVVVYSVGGVISLVGAIDVVYLVLGCLLLVSRGQLFMRAVTIQRSRVRNRKRFLLYFLVALSLPAVAVVGFANKIGFERTYDIISDPGTFRDYFIAPLILRVSSSHGSFVANAELPLSVSEQAESIAFPINNMIWRSCTLFAQNGCPDRGDITHIARLNYTRTYWDQSPLKAGATPGLLASALYIPFLPFSILILSVYCGLFTSAISRAVHQTQLSMVGIFTLVLFCFPVFENPIDILIIFDPAVAYSLGLLLILRSFRSDWREGGDATALQADADIRMTLAVAS